MNTKKWILVCCTAVLGIALWWYTRQDAAVEIVGAEVATKIPSVEIAKDAIVSEPMPVSNPTRRVSITSSVAILDEYVD